MILSARSLHLFSLRPWLLTTLCLVLAACQPSQDDVNSNEGNTDTFIRGKLNTAPVNIDLYDSDEADEQTFEVQPASNNVQDSDSLEEPSAGEEPSADEELLADKELSSIKQQPTENTDSLSSDSSVPTDRENLLAGKQTDARFCLSDTATNSANSVLEDCRRISKRLASVSFEACTSANLKAVGCASNDGFPLYVTDFPPLKSRTPHGRILVIGGTHGDELTSVSVVFRWIEKLNEFHSGLFHWRIAPLMNPDGVLPKEATRVNGNGVDLNRNMPSSDWHEKALLYWNEKTNQDPRKYPGASPASEPESQWLLDEINEFRPDAIISVHAPYGIVDFDALQLNTAPKSLGKLRLNMLGTYPGSLGNFAGINRDIPVITLELPHSWVMPSQAESTRIWEDIVSWLKKNIDTRDSASQQN